MLSRRTLFQAGLAGGALAWAGSAAWSGAHAGERPRLVFVNLQGGADGLSLAPPLRDDRYAGLRGPLAITAPLPFTPEFGLHPSLQGVSALARTGQVRLAPAVGGPGRSRSHGADTQALLTGMARQQGEMSGWLNRALTALSPKGPLPALALETVSSEALAGPAVSAAWAPGAPGLDPAMLGRLHGLYKDDALLKPLLQRAERVQTRMNYASGELPSGALAARATIAGRMLAQDDGPVAVFLSHGGYDTHVDQGHTRGLLADRLRELDDALTALRKEAGGAWARTVVVVATEFGRTAAANGGGGTDHGTASAALLLGGALAKGGPIGDWAGLAAPALYENRDLAPGVDVRALFKGVLAEHWGLSPTVLDADVFPGSQGAPALKGLIA